LRKRVPPLTTFHSGANTVLRKSTLAVVAFCTVPLLASAQSMTSSAPLNTQDKMFIQNAAYAGLAEVSDGKLAESRGSSAVKTIGTRMVTDHTKVNDQLATLSKQLGDPAPTMTDATHLKMHVALELHTGSTFDTHYLKDELLGHEKTIALFKMEMQDGGNTQLKSLASNTLPTLQMHLNMIEAAMKSSSKTM
jgi:putative membrane protein